MSAFLYFLQITKGFSFSICIVVPHYKQVDQSTHLTKNGLTRTFLSCL